MARRCEIILLTFEAFKFGGEEISSLISQRTFLGDIAKFYSIKYCSIFVRLLHKLDQNVHCQIELEKLPFYLKGNIKLNLRLVSKLSKRK